MAAPAAEKPIAEERNVIGPADGLAAAVTMGGGLGERDPPGDAIDADIKEGAEDCTVEKNTDGVEPIYYGIAKHVLGRDDFCGCLFDDGVPEKGMGD